MFSRFRRFSLAAKVTAISMLALAALAAITLGVTIHMLSKDSAARAAERQTVNMGIAWEVLGRYGDKFEVKGDQLTLNGRALNDFDAPVDRIKQLVGGTATIFRGDTRIATNVLKDDGSRAVGTKLAAGPVHDAVLRDGKPYRGQADILGKSYYTAYDPIRDAGGKVVGVLYVGIPEADITAGASSLRLTLIGASLLALLVACGALLYVTRRIFAPLAAMSTTMKRLAQGDTGAQIPAQDSQDEIGEMARALEVLREAAAARAQAEDAVARNHRAIDEVVNTLGAALTDLSNGRISTGIEREFTPEYAALRANFNEAVAGLRELIGAVVESTAAISTGSHEIAEASDDLARRSESNAASIEETNAAISQIHQRLDGTAQSARQTVDRANAAASIIDNGRVTAERAVATMGRVSESAQGIDSVIEGLDKIAFQTRVLAMNAAVEAGRAGEAGRGFAVVADLVSALAMRAEEEAKRAREQLTVTQDEVASAVEAVRGVDEALVRIVETVGEVNALLETMAEDNSAQSGAMSEISSAISAMDQSTQQNAAMVEQTSAAARALLAHVSTLAQQASRFDTGTRTAPRAVPPTPTAPRRAPQTRPAPAKRLDARTMLETPFRSEIPAAAVAALKAPRPSDDWDEF